MASVVLLAACSGGGGENQGAEGAKESSALTLQPGEWEMSTEVLEMTLAGKAAPTPGPAKMNVSTRTCITPEQVAQPEPTVFAGSNGSCKYDNFYMSGGRLVSAMTCAQPGGGEMKMSTEGSFTPTSIDATMEMTSSVSAPGDMKMKARLQGKRLGDCPAESAAKA